NIVMNGGLYPAEEIANSFASLERTLAPIEHPSDSNGNFISANDPDAIHNFHGGAFNQNVRQENGRIHIDKVINVVEAQKTERGKRLLDRVEEIETNDNPRPIHTSTGVFLVPEDTNGIKTNEAGQEYTWVATEMTFDHDAILLDNVGAAQPHQGVGMAVNASGEECEVQTFINQDVVFDQTPDDKEMSHEEIESALRDAIRKPPLNGDWVVRVFPSTFIFESGEQLFSAPYTIREKKAIIMGIPLPVERDETFKIKTNEQDDDMREVIVNALKAAGVETENLDDAAILAKYNELQANQSEGDDDKVKDTGADLAAVVANALKPVTDEIAGLKAQLNAKDESELDKFAEIVGNSDKYPGIDVESAKKMGIDTLKGLSANCGESYGIPPQNNSAGGQDDAFKAPSADTLPE
ncbi:MAG: hypothetical protein ABUK13_07620, partial [Gammaproteobacteria bacterium]